MNLEEKVEAIKKHVGPHHSAYKQAEMDLQQHQKGIHCEINWCVIEHEYQKTIKNTNGKEDIYKKTSINL
jgi:hypothetical protein